MKKITSFFMALLLGVGFSTSNANNQGMGGQEGLLNKNNKPQYTWTPNRRVTTNSADHATSQETQDEITEIRNAREKMKEWLNNVPHTVGYPSEAARTTYRAAIEKKETTLAELKAAQETFMATTDIIVPENGKSYFLVSAAIPNDDKIYNKNYYLTKNYSGEQVALEPHTPDVTEGGFTCIIENGKYIFKNRDGKYLGWTDKEKPNHIYKEELNDLCRWEFKSGQEYCNDPAIAASYLSAEKKFGSIALLNTNGFLFMICPDGLTHSAIFPKYDKTPGDQYNGLGGDDKGIVGNRVFWYLEEVSLEDALKSEARAWLKTVPQSVGYPTQNARDIYANEIDAAQNEEALNTAKNKFLTTEDIVKPVPGKAYTMKMVTTTGKNWYLKSNGVNGGKFEEDKNNADIFICQTDIFNNNTDKFIFVSNTGHAFTAINATENTYAPNGNVTEACKFTFESITANNKNEELLGKVSLIAEVRNAKNGKVKKCITIMNDGTLATAETPCYDEAMTSAVQLEETTYANTPLMSEIQGNMIVIPGAKAVATFSAPFATMPAPGYLATAYCITEIKSVNGTKVAQLQKLSTLLSGGTIIPSNTGVILASATPGPIVMVPALSEPGLGDNLEQLKKKNLLSHTAGANQLFDAMTIFILANGNKGTGFYLGKGKTGEAQGTLKMNKAYVLRDKVTGASGVNALKLVYDDGVTGIEGVTADRNLNAPIYDLSGRRVMNTVKGGIYIQNGKKFIVK